MEIKNIADLHRIHEQFASQFPKQLEALSKGQPPSTEARIAAVRASLESARNAAAAAERKHATLVKRAATELAQHRELVARLEGELDGLDGPAGKGSKQAARAAKPK